MANGFDRRGAVVGAALLAVVLLVAAAFLFSPTETVRIKIDIPPAPAGSR
jgi:hypothetical protein